MKTSSWRSLDEKAAVTAMKNALRACRGSSRSSWAVSRCTCTFACVSALMKHRMHKMDNKNRGIVSLSAYINISHRRIREKIAACVFFCNQWRGVLKRHRGGNCWLVQGERKCLIAEWLSVVSLGKEFVLLVIAIKHRGWLRICESSKSLSCTLDFAILF